MGRRMTSDGPEYGRRSDNPDPLPSMDDGNNGGVWLAVIAAFVLLILVLAGMANSPLVSSPPGKAAATSSTLDAKGYAEPPKNQSEANSPPAKAPARTTPQTVGASEVTTELLSRRYATMRYNANALEAPSEAALKEIAIRICDDIRNGDTGRRYYPSPDIPGPGSGAAISAEALNYAYATTTACHQTSTFELGNTVRSRLLNYIREGSIPPVPAKTMTLPPSEPHPYIPSKGRSVMCKDGSSSKAGGNRGACSWHGGVSN